MQLKDRKFIKNTFPRYYGGADGSGFFGTRPLTAPNTNYQYGGYYIPENPYQTSQFFNKPNPSYNDYLSAKNGGDPNVVGKGQFQYKTPSLAQTRERQQTTPNPTGAIGSAGLGPWGAIAEIAAQNAKGFLNEATYKTVDADEIKSNQNTSNSSFGGVNFKVIDTNIDKEPYLDHWSTKSVLTDVLSGNPLAAAGKLIFGKKGEQERKIARAKDLAALDNAASFNNAYEQYLRNGHAEGGKDAMPITRGGNAGMVNTAYGKRYMPQNSYTNKGEQIVDTLTYNSYKVKNGHRDNAPTFLRGRDAVLTASKKKELLNPETGNTFAEDWPVYKAAGIPQRLLDLQSYVHMRNNMNNKNRRNGYITAKTGEDAILFYDDLLADLPNTNVYGKKPNKIGELLRAAQYTPNITNNIGDIDYSYLFDNLKSISGVPVGANLTDIGRIPTSIVDTGSPRMFPDKHNNSIGAVSYYPRMSSTEQPDTDNLAYKLIPQSRSATTPPFYFYGNSNRTPVKNSPDKKPSSLTPDNVSSIVPPIDFGLESYNITNPQQSNPKNNKPGLDKNLKRIDKGRIPEIKPWEILASRLPGFASSIIGAINTKKQPTSKINSYRPNTYAGMALPKLAGLRINNIPVLRDIDSKLNAYMQQLASQSSLTAGQKQLYHMAAVDRAQRAKANAIYDAQIQNNKYVSDWANAAINVGDKDASNRIATTQYDKQYMDRALAARNKIYNSFLTDIYNQTGATTRDLMNIRMLNAMLNRYQA